MGMRINTNIQALTAQRHLGNSNRNLQSSLERLSSGQRINKAGDDAAGLAISEKLKANIRSMGQAHRNANDGISLVQVAEGAMNELSNILIRMRELSIQGASDTIGDLERGFIDKEVQQLKQEIDRISASTEFNGRKLLDGSEPMMEIQVGIKNNPLQDRLQYDTTKQVTTLETLGLGEVSVGTKENAQNNLAMVDVAIQKINESRSELGALQNRLGSTINNLAVYKENLEAANSRIRDTDMATESSELVKQNVLTQSGISVLSQANQNTAAVMKLL